MTSSAGKKEAAITKISLAYKKKFEQDYKKLSPDIRAFVDEALRNLLQTPMPKSLRFEKLTGIRNPSVYTIHVTPNHSHKISLEKDGSKIILRRIGTHKLIDRCP